MERMLMVGLCCVHPDYEKRPTVREAATMIRGEAPLPVLPTRKPAFSGINGVLYHTPQTLEEAGAEVLLSSLGLGTKSASFLISAVTTLLMLPTIGVAMKLMDISGRKVKKKSEEGNEPEEDSEEKKDKCENDGKEVVTEAEEEDDEKEVVIESEEEDE